MPFLTCHDESSSLMTPRSLVPVMAKTWLKRKPAPFITSHTLVRLHTHGAVSVDDWWGEASHISFRSH
jgi:hypothetical protein